MALRDEFLADIKSAVSQCYELGYAPTRFEQMIEANHPVEVAKKFVISGEFQYGFKEGGFKVEVQKVQHDAA